MRGGRGGKGNSRRRRCEVAVCTRRRGVTRDITLKITLAATAPTTAGNDGRAVDGASNSSVVATGAEERDSSSKGFKGGEWTVH